MSTAISHTLPMLQLVCNLVIVDNSTTIPDETQPPIPAPPPPGGIPDGWVAYPNFGVSYKVFNESVTWIGAIRRCIAEGAHLAAIDSFNKILAVTNQLPLTTNRHVGLYSLEGTTPWWYVRTGLSIVPSALPNTPGGIGRCMVIQRSSRTLSRALTTAVGDFVCEIPYSAT